jgi:hypothetical protein
VPFGLRAISPLVVLLLLVGVSVYFAIPGCNPIEKVGQPDQPLPTYHLDRPFLFIHMTPDYPAPNRRLVSGVIIAIYPDGRIIRAASESTIGESYIRGHLSPENLAQARRILHDSGLLSTKPGGSLVVDAAAEHVGIRYGARVTSWAHSPGFENSNNSDSTNPRITRLKNHLLALPLEDARPDPSQEWSRYPTEFYEGDPSNSQ